MFRAKLKIASNEKRIVDITFEIEESLALVGESGSGKSLTLKALLDLLPSTLHRELDVEWSYPLIRGKTVSLVPQNPFTALSPLTKIKEQFFTDKQKASKLLALVGLSKELLERYPPQLSGGQIQRVVIAMALAQEPKLLLLDEPTTALDHHSKEVVLELLLKLQRELKFLILFVTHDIESARRVAQKIAIIKDGKIVESGDVEEVLSNPKSAYTKVLIESNFKTREFRK